MRAAWCSNVTASVVADSRIGLRKPLSRDLFTVRKLGFTASFDQPRALFEPRRDSDGPESSSKGMGDKYLPPEHF